jgi:hypothetical protein
MMGRGAGFNANDVDLKNRLCDVEANCRDRLHD